MTPVNRAFITNLDLSPVFPFGTSNTDRGTAGDNKIITTSNMGKNISNNHFEELNKHLHLTDKIVENGDKDFDNLTESEFDWDFIEETFKHMGKML